VGKSRKFRRRGDQSGPSDQSKGRRGGRTKEVVKTRIAGVRCPVRKSRRPLC